MFFCRLRSMDDKSWNSQLIRALFSPEDANSILSIPIPSHDVEDALVWLPDKRGRFSVKSTYLEAKKHRFHSDDSPTVKLLRSVWNSKLHERLKILLWRCFSGGLSQPGKISLHVSKVLIQFVQCATTWWNRHPISSSHIHLQLSFGSPHGNVRMRDFCPNGMEEWLSKSVTPDPEAPIDFLLAGAITMEAIWSTRNSLIFRNNRPNMVSPVSLMKRKYAEMSAVSRDQRPPQAPPAPLCVPSIRLWRPIPLRWFKVNCDVACRGQSFSAAAIIRDHRGMILWWQAVSYSGKSVLEGEIKGILIGVESAVTNGWSPSN